MKVAYVKIKNIKSFNEEVKIDFDEKFNILIGPNGGGKSNLLDIITICIRCFFLKGYREEDSNTRITHYNNININAHLDKFIGDNTDSFVEINFKVSKEDLENIKLIKNNKLKVEPLLEKYTFTPHPYNKENNHDKTRFFDGCNIEYFNLEQEFMYSIKNGQLQNPEPDTLEYFYLHYLNYFEFFLLLSKTIEKFELAPIYLYFSPYRGEAQQNFKANLASENFYGSLINYFAYTSKSITSFIRLSSLYFAEKRRKYEFYAQTDGYEKNWINDPEVSLVTKYLEKIGYSWRLQLSDINKNIYEIILTKSNWDFYVEQISSGEKEMLNFLLGIFAFKLKDGLIVIDEPEVHLHPKWQKVLIDLFIELSDITGNQFILSTHSSVFINEKTISNITRIYRNDNKSQVITIDKANLNPTKDLLHIVKSQNNEKMFFADKVVLVEGIIDRLIFEKLINLQYASNNQTESIEVIEVTGKENLAKYRNFLDTIKVKNYIIADLDYILNIGDESVKVLFVTDYQKMDEGIKHKKSMDAIALSESLENAINSEDIRELKNLWEYLKGRKKKLKDSLSENEKSSLEQFITNKYGEKIYILKQGEIENYLPEGYKVKVLEKVIELTNKNDFLDDFDSDKLEEMKKIVSCILQS